MSYNRTSVLEKELERLLHWIGAAESRLAFIFSLSTAMIGALAISVPEIASVSSFFKVSISLTILLLGLSIIFIACASFPRTSGPARSLIYFGCINTFPLKEYSKFVSCQTEEEYILDLMAQCHRNAQIATTKFAWIQRSLICTFASILPWSISMFASIKG